MENRLYKTTFYDNEKDKSGGGSSDFSIAKVTVTLTYTNNPFPFAACDAYSDEDDTHLEVYDVLGSSCELNVPLYKGKAIFYANTNSDPSSWGTIVCTGGVEYSSEDGCIIITGDGTITATEFSGGDSV